jgi:GNAT superfamily N-acetyltransferase
VGLRDPLLTELEERLGWHESGTGRIRRMHSLGTLPTSSGTVTLREAVVDDVPTLVELLAADQLGSTRESADSVEGLAPYLRAFEAIDADPAHLLVVADADRRIVATMQLTFIPGLARRGALRAQIEAVRVHAQSRGSGIGGAMIVWAIDEARRRGCALVQLTSDKQRAEAHRFYSALGFIASHEGFKLIL